MDDTQKLLQSVVENARTGLDACEQLIRKTKDAAVRDQLMTQRERYQSFAQDAERALCAAGGQPHAKNPMGRRGMWMGIQMNTMTDDSASHIAEIVIQGATMGVVELTKARHAYADADPDAQCIAGDFISGQQESIERMKALFCTHENSTWRGA